MFRRSTSFTNTQRDTTSSIQLELSGPAVPERRVCGRRGCYKQRLDHPALNGGNLNGDGSLNNDQYIPYSANGTFLERPFILDFRLGHQGSCWEGEGPYYTTQGGTTSGGNVYTYYRPDGRFTRMSPRPTRAIASTWTYVYPVNASYDKVDPADRGPAVEQVQGHVEH